MVGAVKVETSLRVITKADHGFSIPTRLDKHVHAELARKRSGWIASPV
jgi:hypothetical protein